MDKIRISCLVNPFAGFERDYDFTPASSPRKVLIAGSGPSGLYAAWVAAKRGHNVTLCEKEGHLGGQFRIAGIPPAKHEILAMIKYNVNLCNLYGVDIRLNTVVTEEFILKFAPDVLIIATGGRPLIPPIEGLNETSYITVAEVLGGAVCPGQNILIAGGGEAGAETAMFLSEHKRDVTIVEMQDGIALESQVAVRIPLLDNLKKAGVRIITNAKITKFFANGIEYQKDGEEAVLGGFDSIILALGIAPNNPFQDSIEDKVPRVFIIGDAINPGLANAGIEAGVEAAFAI